MAAENIDMNDVGQQGDPLMSGRLTCAIQDEFEDVEGAIRMVEFEANTSSSDEDWLEDTADTATLLRQR